MGAFCPLKSLKAFDFGNWLTIVKLLSHPAVAVFDIFFFQYFCQNGENLVL